MLVWDDGILCDRFLTAFSSPIPVYMFFVNRILSLLKTFLQTYFLRKLERCTKEGKTSVFISFTGILMMIKNLMVLVFVQLNLPYHRSRRRRGRLQNIYIHNILGPVMIFYRFFSGMISYLVYYKFRPYWWTWFHYFAVSYSMAYTWYTWKLERRQNLFICFNLSMKNSWII